ncbi:MAG: S-methyl-5'-thioadenosine phosphorylase [Actinomycetota bacterium]|nr:S-methyl-5'-thioadenosine phosphorylase [Actinomycetota bacterium]
MSSGSSSPRVAVIGGSGFYEFLDDPRPATVATPYGDPSAPISVGTVAGRLVAFLPRHGRAHEYPPHRINYRANIWALRALGVRRVLAPCAVGALDAALLPGTVVVPDQLVDRTTSRVQTFMDQGAVHAPFADPYCPRLRLALLAADDAVVDGGTVVVVEGPRFSTRAESQSFAAAGWSLVNMTGQPEAALARELGLCYATLALVTDSDAGVVDGNGVDQALVFAEFARHIDRLKDILGVAIPAADIGTDSCGCAAWLAGISLPFELP